MVVLRLTLECGHYQLHEPEKDPDLTSGVFVGDPAPRICVYCRPSSHPPVVNVEAVATVHTRPYWEHLQEVVEARGWNTQPPLTDKEL